MSEFRTFSGKTVDDAMEEACRQLGSAREKLEIEILSGGSSGIFGLVGKKKAQVRARLREEIDILAEIQAEGKKSPARSSRPSHAAKPATPKAAPPRPQPERAPAQGPAEPSVAPQDEPEAVVPAVPVAAAAPVAAQAESAPEEPARAEDAAPEVAAAPETEAVPEAEATSEAEATPPAPARDDRPRDDRPRDDRPREERAPQSPPQPMTPELEALVREVMERMMDGILGQIPPLEISGNAERVNVLVNDEENSGLLIGREGQTLASIQYLVNRIVIRRHGDPVKVQINTGEYRERQDDNLRKMAIFLADKAKSLGRPQSTKPLSSYHRRVVHLALQEDEAISTRSKGDGPLKRVLIIPRATNKGDSQNGQGA